MKERLFKNIILFHYWIQNFLINSIIKLLFSNKELKKSKRILIFRTGSIGDSICAFPAIYSVRKNFPKSKIDILTNAGGDNLVSIEHLIDKSIVDDIINYYGKTNKEIFLRLKKKYDLFIEFTQDNYSLLRQLRNIFFAKSIGVKYGFGWEISASSF